MNQHELDQWIERKCVDIGDAIKHRNHYAKHSSEWFLADSRAQGMLDILESLIREIEMDDTA